MNKRIKAFTIMEIMIAMLITTIVIGITYTAFTIVNRSYTVYQQRNENIETLVRLDELLKKDFLEASFINRTTTGICIKLIKDSVVYDFEQQFVTRISIHTDTFKLQVQDVAVKFESTPSYLSGSDQNSVDELDIKILFEEAKFPYYYHKQYSSENLFTKKPNAIN